MPMKDLSACDGGQSHALVKSPELQRSHFKLQIDDDCVGAMERTWLTSPLAILNV